MDISVFPIANQTQILEAQCGNTNVAMTTMLTGVTPFQHGITAIRDCKLSEEIIAFPEFLRRNHDFYTYAWVGNFILHRACNPHYAPWFDFYDDDFDIYTRPCELLDLDELNFEQDNTFAWIHLNDLHFIESDEKVCTLQQALVLRQERLQRIAKVISKIRLSGAYMILTGDHPDTLIDSLSPYVGHADYMQDLYLPVLTYNFELVKETKIVHIAQKDLLRIAYNRLAEKK
jgi:hypothetical protein